MDISSPNTHEGSIKPSRLIRSPPNPQGRYGGLFVSASGNHRRSHGDGIGVPAASSASPADIATVAQDVAVAFGRPYRLLHSGCVTSPQVICRRPHVF